jgi:hypothetical protein
MFLPKLALPTARMTSDGRSVKQLRKIPSISLTD